MKVTIRSKSTAGEIVARILRTYGSRERLRAQLRSHPQDVAARVALHNLGEYQREPPGKRVEETREVIIPDARLGVLTGARLQLLIRLRMEHGEIEGVRRLAALLDRDPKNVSEDVEALRELGLLDVEAAGRGRPSRIRLPGEDVTLHLVESGATA